MTELEGFGEIIQEFTTEATEILEDLTEKFTQLEQNRDDSELLNEIFRAMHTVKGSSGFLGFTDIGIVAHKSEDILNKYRKKEAVPTTQNIDILIEAVDLLFKQIEQIKKGDTLSIPIEDITNKLVDTFENLSLEQDTTEKNDKKKRKKKKEKKKETIKTIEESPKEELVEEVEEVLETEDNAVFEGDMKEIIEDFIVETKDILDKMDNDFLSLEENPEDLPLLNEIFRHVHTIKGTGSFLGFHQLTSVTHVAEDLLNLLRKGEKKITTDTMDALLNFVDILKLLLADIDDKNLVPRDINTVKTELKGIMSGNKISAKKSTPRKEKQTEKKEKMDDNSKDIKSKDEAALADKVVPEDNKILKREVIKRTPDQTIRVDVSRLEALLNLVGELVLGRNRLQQVNDDLFASDIQSPIIEELNRVNSDIANITKSIQEAVMKTRMVAIGKVFNKFPRMIRDLAKQTGKSIELLVEGAETELDKTLVEEISDPLVHLIRNSADHGIEDSNTRLENGKPEKGRVTLAASQEGDNIVISVEDDGKGVDVEVIKKKAIERELISVKEAERLTDKEIFNFIFAPGFSTAKKVTSVSGRGVGMDVVKTNIAKLNGHIEIESEVGVGSKILIKLPLTLAIITGLLVNVKQELFAIPISAVREITNLSDGQLTIVNKKEVFKLRDEIIPLIRFTDVFNLPGSKSEKNKNLNDAFVVVVAYAEKSYGFIVDSVKEGQAEIVIKKLGEFMPHVQGVTGGTIMGDGRVRLIVDIQEIIRMASK